MEKNAATVCLHDLAGLLGNLQEHIIELEIQANQLTQFEQRMKFTGVCGAGLFLYLIFASAKHLPSIAFATLFILGSVLDKPF
jgi:hypothetical protein